MDENNNLNTNQQQQDSPSTSDNNNNSNNNEQQHKATPSSSPLSKKKHHNNPKQRYFTCCNTLYRIPPQNDIYGVIFCTILFIVCTSLFLIIPFSIYTTSNPFILSKATPLSFLIIALITFPTFFLSICTYYAVVFSIPGYQLSPQITKELYDQTKPTQMIGNVKFELKYCETCHIVRNVRTFHCKNCGKCIERHDHHCGYISNCIGKDNNKLFVVFLIMGFIHTTYLTVVCVYVLAVLYAPALKEGVKGFVWYTVDACAVGLFAFIFMFFMGVMVIQQFMLICENETTNERLRGKYDYSVFDKGCKENCKEVFCVKKGNISVKDIENVEKEEENDRS